MWRESLHVICLLRNGNGEPLRAHPQYCEQSCVLQSGMKIVAVLCNPGLNDNPTLMITLAQCRIFERHAQENVLVQRHH